MTDDELPPRQREEGDPAATDAEEPAHVVVRQGASDADGTPRPASSRGPDAPADERTAESGSGDADDGPGGAPGLVGEEPVVEPVEPVGEPVDERVEERIQELVGERIQEPVGERIQEPVDEPVEVPAEVPAEQEAGSPAARDDDEPKAGGAPQPRAVSGHTEPPLSRAAARDRLGHAMRPRATRAQLLAGALCALLGFALVVQARQTQTQGLDSLRQADLVRLLDNVTNAEARAEQDVRDEQAIRDRLLSGTGSSAAAQEAAQKRLDTLGLLAGTVPASGPGIELEITDPRRQVDAATLLDTLEELRDGGAEVIQIGPVRVVASTSFTDEADGVRVDTRVLTPPYTFKVIGEPQTLARLLQIPGGVLDVLHSKGASGRVTQLASVTIDALRSPTRPQYARPAPGATP